MRIRKRLASSSLSAALVLLVFSMGCGTTEPPVRPPPPNVISLDVSPDTFYLSSNSEAGYEFSVDVVTEGGASSDVHWFSTDSTVVAVNQNGVVWGIHLGRARVGAVSVADSTVSDTSVVTVVEPAN